MNVTSFVHTVTALNFLFHKDKLETRLFYHMRELLQTIVVMCLVTVVHKN